MSLGLARTLVWSSTRALSWSHVRNRLCCPPARPSCPLLHQVLFTPLRHQCSGLVKDAYLDEVFRVDWRFFGVDDFNPRSSFSKVEPLLDHTFLETDENGKNVEVGMEFDQLFHTSLSSDEKEKIISVTETRSLKTKHDLELDVILDVTETLIVPLFGKVTFENHEKYSAFRNKKNYEVKFIGMGTGKTWHGSPDLRINEDFLVLFKDMNSNELDMDVTSDDDTDSLLSFDGKKTLGLVDLDQLAATTITNSFVQRKIFGTCSSPTVMFDGKGFIACVYDCENDFLLFSDKVLLVNVGGGLDARGVGALWTIANHRRTLKTISPDYCKYKSGVRERLRSYRRLQHFEALDDLNVDTSQIRLQHYNFQFSRLEETL